MTTQDTGIAELARALVTAMGDLSDIRKGKEAKVQMKSGGSYGYKYADLADTIQQIRPVLAQHGLAVLQSPVSHDNDTVSIYTTIIHTSGQQLTFGPLTLPAGRTAQETGSAITYGRRYALLSCLGLAAEDDDGASAAPRRSSAQQSKPQPVKPVSEQEAEIRSLLAQIPSADAKEIKAQFMDQFGKLADLPLAQHGDALEWVRLAVNMSASSDDEWIAQAKGEAS
jgi:hypothetical protein